MPLLFGVLLLGHLLANLVWNFVAVFVVTITLKFRLALHPILGFVRGLALAFVFGCTSQDGRIIGD